MDDAVYSGSTTATLSITGATQDMTTNQYRVNVAGSSPPEARSEPATLTVNKGDTTMTLAASPDPSVFGQTVTLTATVAAVAPASGTPTGSVIFSGPSDFVEMVALGSDGTASVDVEAADSGMVAASYSGDDRFKGSQDTADMTVGMAKSSTTLFIDPNPAVIGQTITLTAFVEAFGPGSGMPTGNVVFSGPGVDTRVAVGNDGRAVHTMTPVSGGTFTATYEGDGHFSSSLSMTDITLAEASVTTVEVEPDPSVAGDTVTLRATVAAASPGGGTPTGYVTIMDPTGYFKVVALESDGTASITVTASASGEIMAIYDGYGGLARSEGTGTMTVLAGTTTSLTASPDNVVTGQEITLTATVAPVAPATGTPTGNVSFKGAGIDRQAPVGADGTASIKVPGSMSGTVTASYAGDEIFARSSDVADITVEFGLTTMTLSVDPETAVHSQLVTLTAIVAPVAPASGTPAGTVSFVGPGGGEENAPIEEDGTASVTMSAIGSGSVSAVYNPSNSFYSSKDSRSLTVQDADTETVLTIDPNPSEIGDTVTVNVTVTAVAPATAVPTGEVQILGPNVYQILPLEPDGSASFTITAAESGTLTAQYSASAGFNDSGDEAEMAVGAQTKTTLAINPNPSVFSETVTLTATVAAVEPGSGTPTGTVRFKGLGVDKQATLESDGTASVTMSGPEVTVTPITATYAGDEQFAGSAGSANMEVNLASTTIELSASPDPSVAGDTVTLTATVAAVAPASGTPTGDVQFHVPGAGMTSVAVDGDGKAELVITADAGGTTTAVYLGDGGFAVSQDIITITVKGATTTALTADPSSSVVGQTVTLTAKVATVIPTIATLTGTVSFKGAGIDRQAAVGADGIASVTVPAAESGTVTATYSGDDFFSQSAGTADMTVDQGGSTTTLTASPDPSVVGQTVTLTATVAAAAPATGVPTGTVHFAGDGLNETVDLVDGVANTTITAAASATVTATYSGSAGFEGSSDDADLTVNLGVSTTALTASPDPSVVGQTVTLTATVAAVAPATGTPTGTVSFKGSGVNKQAALGSDGTASVTITAAESVTVTASYAGDAAFDGSDDTADLTVNLGGTTTTVTASPASSTVGETVTLTASVSPVAPATGTPTGSVTFAGPGGLNQTAGLDASGKASVTTTTLETGTVTATYGGDSVLAGSDGSVDVTVDLRPDPTTDAEVTGLLAAQYQATQRFATTQIGNFRSRLEKLHSDSRRFADPLGVIFTLDYESPPRDYGYPLADPGQEPRDGASERQGAAGFDPDQSASRPGTAGLRGADDIAHAYASGEDETKAADGSGTDKPDPFAGVFGADPATGEPRKTAIWSGGFVDFGSDERGGIDLDHTMVGVSGGVDHRFSRNFVAGFGIGYGRETADVGSNGTESEGRAFSAAVYGSYHPANGTFLDALAGYSHLDFDSTRYVTPTGDYAEGSRDGNQVFGSVTAGYEHRQGLLLLSPYAGLEAAWSRLGAFSESGGGPYDLTYGEQDIDMVAGLAGLRAEYAMPQSWGLLTARGRLEYTHDFSGSSNASMGYTDVGGIPPYALDIDGISRDYMGVGLGFDAGIGQATTIGFDYGTGFSFDGDVQDHNFRLRAGISF